MDVAHWNALHLIHLWDHKRLFIIILFYVTAMLLHLTGAKLNDKIYLLGRNYTLNETHINMTENEIVNWITVSCWKDVFALLGWICIGVGTSEDLLTNHLKSMVQYASFEN